MKSSYNRNRVLKKLKEISFNLLGFWILIAIPSCNDDDPLSTGTLITVFGNQSGTYIADANFDYYVLSKDTLGAPSGTYFSLSIEGHKASAPQLSIVLNDYKNPNGFEIGRKYSFKEMENMQSTRYDIRIHLDAERRFLYYINEENPGTNWIRFTYLGPELFRGNFEFNLETIDGEKITSEGYFFAAGTSYLF